MSKGSKRRPSQISAEEAAARWDAVFGKTDCVKKVKKTKTDEK